MKIAPPSEPIPVKAEPVKVEPVKKEELNEPIKAGKQTAMSRFELEKEIERELGMAMDALMKDESNTIAASNNTPNIHSHS